MYFLFCAKAARVICFSDYATQNMKDYKAKQSTELGNVLMK